MKMYDVFKKLAPERLDEILSGISKVKIALIGDLCIDIYWKADMTKSELSRETPHFPLPIVEEYMSPGGGGNVAANIAALTPYSLKLLGVVGMDWRGEILLSELVKRNIRTDGIIKSNKRVTTAFCKPIRRGISYVEYEDPRLDFDNYEPLDSEIEEQLLEQLNEAASDIDVLCVSDQVEYGCITASIREKIMSLAKQGLKVIVDSRNRIAQYNGVTLKPNEVEGLRAVRFNSDPRKASLEKQIEAAEILAASNNAEVCMTLGSKGCVCVDGSSTVYVPSYAVVPPIDICGAGDTFLSAFSCASAAGAKSYEAAAIANMAANVTIKKIGTTGTATMDEILSRYAEIISIEEDNESQREYMPH